MSSLTRDAILAALDLPTETVDVPEWGGSVVVRGLNGTDRDAFEAEMFQSKGKDTELNRVNLRSRLLVRTVVGEDGKRLFTDTDIAPLGAKSAVALDRVFGVSMRLSGIGEKDVDELVKNSDSGPGESSPSIYAGNLAA